MFKGASKTPTDEEMFSYMRELINSGDMEELESFVGHAERVFSGMRIALTNAQEWAENFAKRDIERNRTLVDSVPIFIENSGRRPHRAHRGDAGADLYASRAVLIPPGQKELVHTDLSIAVPFGFVAKVYSRSGLCAKKSVRVANSVGVIDYGYKGEVLVELENFGDKPFAVKTGDRIAQLVIEPVALPKFNVVAERGKFEQMNASNRGANGHGSTGV